MKTKKEKTDYNSGIFYLIMGICGLVLLLFIPFVALPLLLLTIIFSSIAIKKKSSVYTKIALGLGILGIIGFLIIAFAKFDMDMYLSSSVDEEAMQQEIFCQGLSEKECIEYQDNCALCGETAASSYASCHSIKFCEGIPFE